MTKKTAKDFLWAMTVGSGLMELNRSWGYEVVSTQHSIEVRISHMGMNRIRNDYAAMDGPSFGCFIEVGG